MLSSKWRMSLEVRLILKNSGRSSKKSGSKSSLKMTNKRIYCKEDKNKTDQITDRVIPTKSWRISCLRRGMLAAIAERKLVLWVKRYNTSLSFTIHSKSKKKARKLLTSEEDGSKLMSRWRIVWQFPSQKTIAYWRELIYPRNRMIMAQKRTR